MPAHPTTRRLGASAGVLAATALMAAAAPATASTGTSADGAAASPQGRVALAKGPLTDLRPTMQDPTDGAGALFVAAPRAGGTVAVLVVRGLAPEAAGRTLGAHVHVGPCVEGSGAAAGPHYNTEAMAGDPAPEASPRTEVWLDITVGPGGTGTAVARVPFRVEPGTRSVVVHERATDEAGTAGPRLACLPVRF
jgi:Cu/Zn superoxide dismutase